MLVDLRDPPIDGLVTPEAQLRDRFPRLASWVAETEFARVEPDLARRLQAAGATTYEVGYHRGVDGLMFAEAQRGQRHEEQVDMSSLGLDALTDEELDALTDEELDALANDRVDALLRIFSEGLVTERIAILAFHAPPLTDTPGPLDEAALSAIEALDPALLPDAPEPFVDRVAAALAVAKTPQFGPSLTPEQRRAYMRKAGVVGVVFFVAGVGGVLWVHPFIGVFALPVTVLCLVIVVLHAVALRQMPSR